MLHQKLSIIVLAGTIVLIVSSCAPTPLEVFLSPNPTFESSASRSITSQQKQESVVQPYTSTQVTVQEVPQQERELVVQPYTSTQVTVQAVSRYTDVDKIVAQMSETLAEAEAHVHAGESRLQEQNLLEAVREFERARTLLAEGVDPSFEYVQQMQSQGGMNILSTQRIQTVQTQRANLLSRINQAYDIQSLLAKQRKLDRAKVLRQENKTTLRPINFAQTPSFRIIQESRPTTYSAPGVLNLNWIVSSSELEQAFSRFRQRQNDFRACLERANRYFPTVTAVLARSGAPEWLAYVALIESGFQPSIESSSGEAGLWQLPRSFARSYGLEVSSYRDERKDIEASTRAFARYVAELYRKFGSWELAILGYESGAQRVQEMINRAGSYELQNVVQSLERYAREREYLAKLAAAMTIANNPREYGFDLNLPNVSNQITARVTKPSISVMTEPPAATMY